MKISWRAILSSLPANVAVVDRHGTVVAVNEAWSESPWALDARGRELIAPGVNYFDVCAAAAEAGCAAAADVLIGVRDVCDGKRRQFELKYQGSLADGAHWFLLKATRLEHEDGGAVVTHADITDRKRTEVVVLESEGRFSRLADALPVGVWMSDVEGACSYCNHTWLDLTGRPLERELGTGWLDAVHPDDRARCVTTYWRAFAAHAPFSMEYRIRRHDGQYRWLLNHGVPRYDADERFLGYLGGAIDFTDQRNAEQALRDLSGRLIAAQETERRRIARDLHDSVGQRMALLSMRIDELRHLLPPGAEGSTAVAQLRADADVIAREVHSLSHRLHSAKLDALGLAEAVASHCREMAAQGVLVDFADAGVPEVPSAVALCVFRIVQEALANVAKHSGATAARVLLSSEANSLVLRVEDDGKGFAPHQPSEGLGLVSMRERVRSARGQLRVASAPGCGTTIEARIPIQSTPEHCPPLVLLSERSETSLG